MSHSSSLRSVLIVDDERSHSVLLSASFREHGYAAELVEEFKSAVTCAASRSHDLVVIDPNLIYSTWVHVLRALRQSDPSAALIVVTAAPSTALVEEAALLGAPVFVKPTTAKEILPRLGARARSGPMAMAGIPRDSLAWVEWEHVNTVLRRCDGNVTAAARVLGIPRQTVYNRLRKAPRLSRANYLT
jgi:two-component system, response regulator RegA